MNASNTESTSTELGIEAYENTATPSADLLLNLEGQRVHRFAEGTGEHAGTALMAVELPTGEGLGVQISMEEDTSNVPVHPDAYQVDSGDWRVSSDTERWSLDTLESPCPDCQIVNVVQKDIMDPDNARVLIILESDIQHQAYGLDIHIGDDGGTEFFELSV